MKVSGAVQELERQYEAMRMRAEKAEGTLRLYEMRDRARSVATEVNTDSDWRVKTNVEGRDSHDFQFSPGLWLLLLTEDFLRNPKPFELRVTRAPSTSNREDRG